MSAPERRGRGFSVALIGPDGAGKTTIARQLPQRLRLPLVYVYMGVAVESSSHLLPTTRLIDRLKRRRARSARGGPTMAQAPATVVGADTTAVVVGDTPRRAAPSRGRRSRAVVRRLVSPIVGGLKLANRLAEEWYRQAVVWRYVRAGKVVVMDRHFTIDFHAADVRDPDRTLRRRIHGWVLTHAYPRPDLVLYLDAPAAILLARKGEGTLESLERRRVEYLEAGTLVPEFQVVDATRPLEVVASDVAERVAAFGDDHRGWTMAADGDEPAVP